jgi:hypothetical protein
MKYMLVRKDAKLGGATNVRFFDDLAAAMEQGRRLSVVFEGCDWWVAEVQHAAYAKREGV